MSFIPYTHLHSQRRLSFQIPVITETAKRPEASLDTFYPQFKWSGPELVVTLMKYLLLNFSKSCFEPYL